MRTEPNLQGNDTTFNPKPHWMCGSSFLYVAQLSHSYSM